MVELGRLEPLTSSMPSTVGCPNPQLWVTLLGLILFATGVVILMLIG